jgi:16S rRNA (cytidine1402-2'-O)-methyltransferase
MNQLKSNQTQRGVLYFAASHIGCLRDIPQRTLEILQKADLILFEEARHARQVLKQAGLHRPFLLFSEHKETDSLEAVKKALKAKQTVVYVSDQGCPNLADPGRELLGIAYQLRSRVLVIPGPSSITSALAVCPFDVTQFYFGGFLPRQQEKRLAHISKLLERREAVILLETPYRRQAFLQDFCLALGAETRRGLLAFDISGEEEQYLLGTLPQIRTQAESLGKKNFVFILEGR